GGLAVELLAHARGELRALVAHHLDEGRLAQHTPQRRYQQGRQPRTRALDRADRLIEPERILDAVAREGVDHQALLIGGDQLLRRRLEVEDALVDVYDAVDKRVFDVQAGIGNDADRIAQLDHDCQFPLVHGEQRAVAHDDQQQDQDGDDAAGKTDPHRVPPVGAGVPAGLCVNSLSGRYGTTPGPPTPGSRMILSVPPNSRSIDSRESL